MKRSDVADCPFCEDGGQPLRHREVVYVMIRCCKCNARGPSFKMNMDGCHKVPYDIFLEPYYAKALEAWNRRAQNAY